MDFAFTPEEEAFRAELQALPRRRAARRGGGACSSTTSGRCPRPGGSAALAGRTGLAHDGVAARVRRRAAPASWLQTDRARGDVGPRGAARPAVHEPQLHRAAHHALRDDGAAAALPPADGTRRGDLVPGLLRARRRLRPGVAHDTRRRPTATTSSSTARRSGRATPTPRPTGACCSSAPTPTPPKHRGISVLLVDMTTPGITVRPIDTMAGPHEFNEVFFDDVVVPRDCLLGEQDRRLGRRSSTGLTFERAGIARYARAGPHHRAARRVGEREPVAAAEPDVRRKLADLRVRYEAARLLNYRAISLQAAGEVPTHRGVDRPHPQRPARAARRPGRARAARARRRNSTADDRWAPLAGEIRRHWERNIPTTIAAGTLEVQKNVVAQRGLGLPRPS